MTYSIGDKGIMVDDGKGGWIFIKATPAFELNIGDQGVLFDVPGSLPVFIKANPVNVGDKVVLVDVPGAVTGCAESSTDRGNGMGNGRKS